ncbi:MAG TPA: PAS domain S-box protein [Polyangiaceae bacterium]|nr:PAS domain S-box protein [Polyangiaceae bacterium]
MSGANIIRLPKAPSLSWDDCRLLVESVVDYAIFMLDVDGYVTTWNLGATRIKGYRAEEIIGQHFSKFFASEDIDTGKPERELTLAAEQGRFEDEGWRVRKDGSRFWANVVITALHDESGKLRGFGKLTRDLTLRKAAEEQLRQAEQRFHHLVDAITDYAVFILDATGHIATWNPGAERVKGYSASEIVGQHFSVFYTTDDRSDGKPERILEIVRRDGRFEDESWRVRKDGSLFWANVVITALRDDHGQLMGFAKVTRDLTERRRQEQERLQHEREVAANEAMLASVRSLVDNLPELAWTAYPDGYVDFYNQRWFDYTGSTLAETDGWKWQALLDPKFGSSVLERWKQAISNGEAFEMEFPIRGGDGVFRWFLTRIRPLRAADGSIARWFGTSTNIDELKREEARRERARGEERARLLTLLRQVPAIVNFLRGPELVFEFVHPLATAAMGGRDVLGKALAVAVPEVVEQPYYQRLRSVYQTGEPITQLEALTWYELDSRRVETYWNSVYLPVCDEQGRIEGVMTFDIDVTQNVLSRRELEAANRAKDEFLATVSHELRTPLNAIVGWAALLRQRSLDPAIAKPVEVIHRNAQAQVRIIDDILDVSRVINGKLQIDPKPTDFVVIVRDALEVIRPSADAKRIKVDFKPDAELCLMVADPERLQQVVWNLLSNSVKFTPSGGTIEVLIRHEDAKVVLTVSDTGQGIDPAFLPFVFDRFKQADASTTRRVGGLGLGLALVRHIVELHGGTVEATSNGIGKGASFSATLPLRAVVAVSAVTSTRGDGTSPAPPSSATLAGVRVLVVDDEADARELVAAVLTNAGAAVETARSASEGFDQFLHFRPDVLVSDIGMPDEDGFSFMRRVRSLPREEGGGVPALALTAFVREEDRTKALRVGYTAHIAKPADPEVLTAAVANLSEIRRRT